eukprot:COSAG01_NODE_55730_length_323_cov_0.691964_1_plen_30_part_10
MQIKQIDGEVWARAQFVVGLTLVVDGKLSA